MIIVYAHKFYKWKEDVLFYEPEQWKTSSMVKSAIRERFSFQNVKLQSNAIVFATSMESHEIK